MRDLIDEISAPDGAPYAKSANHWPGKGGGCLIGTRTRVLREIRSWSKYKFWSPIVYLLEGFAGTGKTAIARTVVERLGVARTVVSFFCSDKKADLCNIKLIIPTLLIQLAHALKHENPELWLEVDRLFRYNPDVLHERWDSQIQRFIEFVEIGARGRKVVIVIDGLDVCGHYEVSKFLSALGKLEFQISSCDLKFFITSRPLEWVSRRRILGLHYNWVATPTSSALHEVDPEDMRLFLKRGLSKRGKDWKYKPTEDELNRLSKYVGGFFPYAAEAVKFIREGTQSPQKQLGLLLSPPEKIYLDSLYVPILKKVIEELEQETFDSENVQRAYSILATISHATNPISPPAIAMQLNLEADQVRLYLDLFRSLFTLREDDTVQPVHHSLIAFLTNRHLDITD